MPGLWPCYDIITPSSLWLHYHILINASPPLHPRPHASILTNPPSLHHPRLHPHTIIHTSALHTLTPSTVHTVHCFTKILPHMVTYSPSFCLWKPQHHRFPDAAINLPRLQRAHLAWRERDGGCLAVEARRRRPYCRQRPLTAARISVFSVA